MPIRPEANPQAGITTGPTIKLESGESIELSWQERALCAQTDPEAFFPGVWQFIGDIFLAVFVALVLQPIIPKLRRMDWTFSRN